jgi:hypothetical protein
LLASLLDHLFNLVEQLGAKVAERLAHDLVDVGPLRRQRDRGQSTGGVRNFAEACARHDAAVER